MSKFKLDPKPWFIAEDVSRISFARWVESGGSENDIQYQLATWRPRNGYSQIQEDYRQAWLSSRR